MPAEIDRRDALKCLGLGAGTLFSLAGGVFTATPLAQAAARPAGLPLFVQISDTHIGFKAAANPDVEATLDQTIDRINALPVQPALLLHTGDMTHTSKAAEFDLLQQHLSRLKVSEIHTTPGEHDVFGGGAAYFERFGQASANRGWYRFDHQGVHFVSLVNVLPFRPETMGVLGAEQLDWLKADLEGRRASQPLVIFAHMPLWTIYAPWGWGTSDADALMAIVRRFGSVTVLNGHIHQVVQKVEGTLTFHTARSTAYPQPAPGDPPGPVPLKVADDELPRRLGLTRVSLAALPSERVTDTTLA